MTCHIGDRTVPKVTSFDTLSEDDMSKSAVRETAGKTAPTIENGTVTRIEPEKVVPFPSRQAANDTDFVAAVRAAGAGVYSDTVARCRSSEPPSCQDDDDGAEGRVDPTLTPHERRSEIVLEGEDRQLVRNRPAELCGVGRRPTPPRKPAAGDERRQYLTESEVDQLCDAARKRGRYGHRDATMILIAYRHGLRVSELVALRWADLDLDAGRMTVRRLKGSDDSVQPLAGVEIRALRRIARGQPAGTRHVFVSERGAPFTANGVFKMLSRAAAAIGMTDVHPHLLRHGTGFKLVNDGVDTRTLAAYLGHRQIANTARYTMMDAKRFDKFWRD
jgi:type 1 fimbriae regulatory protein FimB/type 1 fimbriae regulatory protein FimE